MEKEYFVFADNQYKCTSVEHIREFLKFSITNGFKYKHKSLNSAVRKVHLNKGVIYTTALYSDAPYVDIVYTTNTGDRYYRVYENSSYNKNAATRLLYTFKKYTYEMNYDKGYCKGDLEALL